MSGFGTRFSPPVQEAEANFTAKGSESDLFSVIKMYGVLKTRGAGGEQRHRRDRDDRQGENTEMGKGPSAPS